MVPTPSCSVAPSGMRFAASRAISVGPTCAGGSSIGLYRALYVKDLRGKAGRQLGTERPGSTRIDLRDDDTSVKSRFGPPISFARERL